MILQSFINISGIDKPTEIAYHLGVSVQSVYNYLDDPSSMKVVLLEKLHEYLKSQSISIKLEFNKEGRLIFKLVK